MSKSHYDTSNVLMGLSGLSRANQLQYINNEVLLNHQNIKNLLIRLNKNKSFHEQIKSEYNNYNGIDIINKNENNNDLKFTMSILFTNNVSDINIKKFREYFLKLINKYISLYYIENSKHYISLIDEIVENLSEFKLTLEKEDNNRLSLDLMNFLILSSSYNIPEEFIDELMKKKEEKIISRNVINMQVYDIIKKIKLSFIENLKNKNLFSSNSYSQFNTQYSIFYRSLILLGFIFGLILSFLISLFYTVYIKVK